MAAALDVGSAAPLRDTSAVAAAAVRQENIVPSAPPVAAGAIDRAGNDPFAVLDAERSTPAPTWIHAGAHHAEAGYLDPALGWVGVRADASGSGVHAAVLPGSAEAAQVLGSHLAGLNAYLAEHHGQPATVTLTTPQDATGVSQGNHSGPEDAGRGDTGRKREESGASQPAGPTGLRAEPATAGANPVSEPPATGGRYISVIA